MGDEWRYELLNNCFRCHKLPYETSPEHWHYCNDCVKICSMCKQLKVLWAFNFDFQSAEYKRWKASDCHGFMNASGHTNECGSCINSMTDSLKPKPVSIKVGGVLQPAQLQLMLDAMRSKPTATEPSATE